MAKSGDENKPAQLDANGSYPVLGKVQNPSPKKVNYKPNNSGLKAAIARRLVGSA